MVGPGPLKPRPQPWYATRTTFAEVQWPFPLDQWGRGKAFECGTADCGTKVRLYIRAKIGFCNCETGVADDEELERISDFIFVGDKVSAMGDGRPISVGWMKGRSRPTGCSPTSGRVRPRSASASTTSATPSSRRR